MMMPSIGMTIPQAKGFPADLSGASADSPSFDSILSYQSSGTETAGPGNGTESGGACVTGDKAESAPEAKPARDGNEEDSEMNGDAVAGTGGNASAGEEPEQTAEGNGAGSDAVDSEEAESGKVVSSSIIDECPGNPEDRSADIMTEMEGEDDAAILPEEAVEEADGDRDIQELLARITKETDSSGKKEPDEEEQGKAETLKKVEDTGTIMKMIREHAGQNEEKMNLRHGMSNSAGHGVDVSVFAGSEDPSSQQNLTRVVLGTPAERASALPAFRDISDGIFHLTSGNNRVGLSLRHDDLGRMNISLTMNKGLVDIHVNAVDRIAREYIENNLQQLMDVLKEGGVSIGGFSIAHREGRNEFRKAFAGSDDTISETVMNAMDRSTRNARLVSVFA